MFYRLGKKLKTGSEGGGARWQPPLPLLVRPRFKMVKLLQKNLMYIISFWFWLTRTSPLLLCFSTLPFITNGKAIKLEISEIGNWLTVSLHLVVTRKEVRSAKMAHSQMNFVRYIFILLLRIRRTIELNVHLKDKKVNSSTSPLLIMTLFLIRL